MLKCFIKTHLELNESYTYWFIDLFHLKYHLKLDYLHKTILSEAPSATED